MNTSWLCHVTRREIKARHYSVIVVILGDCSLLDLSVELSYLMIVRRNRPSVLEKVEPWKTSQKREERKEGENEQEELNPKNPHILRPSLVRRKSIVELFAQQDVEPSYVR